MPRTSDHNQALQSVARRADALRLEAESYERDLIHLVNVLAPRLAAEPGIGPICAGQILNAWSHRGRLRSDAAFAALAGVAPIPASSGQTVRHRLNRGGDRQLNRALRTIVMWRTNFHTESKAYLAKRRHEGKTDREIRRCLNVTWLEGSSSCSKALTAYRSISTARFGGGRNRFDSCQAH